MNDLPSPLTPDDCDLKDFAFMPLDVQRLRDSDLASEETPECCWAAVLIWCASWHQVPAASVPDSDQWLANQAGYVSRGKIDSRWKKVRDGALRGWIKCSDGRLYHAVVAEKALEAWIGKLTQRLSSGAGNAKRWNTSFEDEPAIIGAINSSKKLLSALNPQSGTLKKKPPKSSVDIPGSNPAGSAKGLPTGVPSGSQERETGIGTERETGNLSSKQDRDNDDDGTSNSVAVAVIDWVPGERIFRDLEFLKEIEHTFIEIQLVEFQAYWRDQDRSMTPGEWDSKFMQRVVEQWDRKQKPLRAAS